MPQLFYPCCFITILNPNKSTNWQTYLLYQAVTMCWHIVLVNQLSYSNSARVLLPFFNAFGTSKRTNVHIYAYPITKYYCMSMGEKCPDSWLMWLHEASDEIVLYFLEALAWTEVNGTIYCLCFLLIPHRMRNVIFVNIVKTSCHLVIFLWIA